MAPLVSVVIPSRDRQTRVGDAVASALAQNEPELEVIVVDDGSAQPVTVPADPRVRIVRRDRPGGAAAARNTGLAEARGRWVTFLDDDDRLLPGMVERALAAAEGSALPPPVATVCGIDVIGPGERVIDRRLPPSHARGEHFLLEHLPRGRSHMTKQTLMAEAGVLRSIDGFDEELPFREWSDLMLRLNPVCSIEGVPVPGYLLSRDGALHMSRESGRVQRGFDALRAKHLDLLEAHPRGHADLLLGQARVALVSGPRRAAPGSIARALRLAPGHTLRTLLDPRRAVAALARPGRTG